MNEVIIEGSSNIASLKFNASKQQLCVTFKSGSQGYYANVTATIYTRLMNSESKGSFLHTFIRSQPERFPFRRTLQTNKGGGLKPILVETSDKPEKSNIHIVHDSKALVRESSKIHQKRSGIAIFR